MKLNGYCYHWVDVIKHVLYQSDSFKRLPLYLNSDHVPYEKWNTETIPISCAFPTLIERKRKREKKNFGKSFNDISLCQQNQTGLKGKLRNEDIYCRL